MPQPHGTLRACPGVYRDCFAFTRHIATVTLRQPVTCSSLHFVSPTATAAARHPLDPEDGLGPSTSALRTLPLADVTNKWSHTSASLYAFKTWTRKTSPFNLFPTFTFPCQTFVRISHIPIPTICPDYYLITNIYIYLMDVRGYLQAPTALPLERIPVTH